MEVVSTAHTWPTALPLHVTRCSIFSNSSIIFPDYGLLLKLHALTLATRSYALLNKGIHVVVLDRNGIYIPSHTCIYEACLSPALSRNSALQHVKVSDALEIHDKIVLGLPHILSVALSCSQRKTPHTICYHYLQVDNDPS